MNNNKELQIKKERIIQNIEKIKIKIKNKKKKIHELNKKINESRKKYSELSRKIKSMPYMIGTSPLNQFHFNQALKEYKNQQKKLLLNLLRSWEAIKKLNQRQINLESKLSSIEKKEAEFHQKSLKETEEYKTKDLEELLQLAETNIKKIKWRRKKILARIKTNKIKTPNKRVVRDVSKHLFEIGRKNTKLVDLKSPKEGNIEFIKPKIEIPFSSNLLDSSNTNKTKSWFGNISLSLIFFSFISFLVYKYFYNKKPVLSKSTNFKKALETQQRIQKNEEEKNEPPVETEFNSEKKSNDLFSLTFQDESTSSFFALPITSEGTNQKRLDWHRQGENSSQSFEVLVPYSQSNESNQVQTDEQQLSQKNIEDIQETNIQYQSNF